MQYEFTVKKGGNEIIKEKGETELKELAEKIDKIIVKMK